MVAGGIGCKVIAYTVGTGGVGAGRGGGCGGGQWLLLACSPSLLRNINSFR